MVNHFVKYPGWNLQIWLQPSNTKILKRNCLTWYGNLGRFPNSLKMPSSHIFINTKGKGECYNHQGIFFFFYGWKDASLVSFSNVLIVNLWTLYTLYNKSPKYEHSSQVKEKVQEHNWKRCLVFVDLINAFPTVSRICSSFSNPQGNNIFYDVKKKKKSSGLF